MQNKVNSSLIITALLLFMIWYPVYIIGQNISINQLSNFLESITEYKYWILWVIIINLLIILWKTLRYKKSKAVQLFLQWRPVVITVGVFIYPLLPDFKQRFWMISTENITDFYAIILPIFIMNFLSSIRQIWDYDVIKEMKNIMWIKTQTNYKTDLLIKKSSIFVTLSTFCFLFIILTWWIAIIHKVNRWFLKDFLKYPMLFFMFILWISILLYKILDNISEKKEIESKKSISQKPKTKRKTCHENMKISFK